MPKEKEYKPGLTVLVQGPITAQSKECMENIPHYKEYGDVVLSSWSDGGGTDLTLLPNVSPDPKTESNLRVVLNPTPDRDKAVGCEKNSTFYWAISSQYHGYELVDTEHVLKIRTDECFTNLQPMIDKHKENPEKFLFGNIFAKTFSFKPYHIGDHVFIAETKHLLGGCKLLLDMYNGVTELEGWAKQGEMVAEQILAFSYVESKGFSGDDRSPTVGAAEVKGWSKSFFWEHFDMFDIEGFDDYLVRYNSANQTFKKNGNPFLPASFQGITDIKDI